MLDLGVNGRIILNFFLKNYDMRQWTGFFWLERQISDGSFDMIINFRFTHRARNFLTRFLSWLLLIRRTCQ